MTTYEMLKNELENRYGMNEYYRRPLVHLKGHTKAATFARVCLGRCGIHIYIQSYATRIMTVFIPKPSEDSVPYLEITGLYSMTTRKHIGWWMTFLRDLNIVPPTWDYFKVKEAWENRKDEQYPRLPL